MLRMTCTILTLWNVVQFSVCWCFMEDDKSGKFFEHKSYKMEGSVWGEHVHSVHHL